VTLSGRSILTFAGRSYLHLQGRRMLCKFLQDIYKFLLAAWYHMEYDSILQYGINEIKLVEISPFAI